MGALTGASKSFGKADFRNLTFHVGGTADNPKLENFKVNGKKWTEPAAPQEGQAPSSGDAGNKAPLPTTKDLQGTLDKKINDEINRATNKLLGIKKSPDAATDGAAPAGRKTDETKQNPEQEKPLTKEDIKKQIQDAATDALNKELQKLFGAPGK